MPDYRERIHADPSILNGKPVIKGTRISVEQVLSRLAEGLSIHPCFFSSSFRVIRVIRG